MASTQHLISIRLALKDEMSGALKKASGGLKEMGASLTNVGAKMTAAFTVPIVAAGVAAVKTAMDFDRSMKNIQSISGKTNEEIAQLGQVFLDMSRNIEMTTDSAQNLADGFYDIQSSGFAGTDALEVLRTATKAASAGLTTTKVAAQGIVAVLNAYGASADEAAHVSDVMFQTVNRGVGTFEELNSAIGQVLSTSSTLGIGFSQVAAALATMSKQGINFNEGSTALNAAMTALISPTEAMEKAFADLGYESGSAMIEALGFAGTMQKLSEYSDGSAEKMQELFGNVRALKAALALTGDGATMFADDLKAMGASAGATQAAFDIQMQSFAASWANFQNTVGVALIEIGNILLPFLADLLLNYITPLVQWFIHLDDTSQGWIITILAIVAAIGPLLIILGQIAGAIVAITTAWATLSAGFAAAAVFVGAITAPMWALIALFTAIGVAIALLIFNWEALGKTISQLGTIIDQSMGGIFSKMRDGIMSIAGKIGEGWKLMLDKAGVAFSQLGKIIVAALSKLGGAMVSIGGAIINGLVRGFAQGVIALIKYVRDVSAQIAQAIRDALGIRSPSRVMMEIGQQTVAGFNKGIASMGGVGVNVNGASVSGSAPSLATAGASSGGGSGVYINQLIVPAGTSQEQVKYMMDEIDKAIKRRGGK